VSSAAFPKDKVHEAEQTNKADANNLLIGYGKKVTILLNAG